MGHSSKQSWADCKCPGQMRAAMPMLEVKGRNCGYDSGRIPRSKLVEYGLKGARNYCCEEEEREREETVESIETFTVTAEERFVNVKCGHLPVTNLNVTAITRLSGLKQAIKECFSLSAGCGLLQLYDENNNRIATWAQLINLPADYFTEEGRFLTVRTSPSPSMEASSVSEFAKMDSTVFQNRAGRARLYRLATTNTFAISIEGHSKALCPKMLPRCLWSACGESEEWLKLFGIMGSPGIGKSLFFIYILHRLLKHRSRLTEQSHSSPLKPTRVIYQTSNGRDCFDLKNQIVFEVTKSEAKHLVRHTETLYIINGHHSLALPSSCVTLFIASPGSEEFYQFRKHIRSLEWCFPVWTEDELISCRQSCYSNVPIAEFHDRLHRYGGSAEYVLNCFRDDLETALADPSAATRVRNHGIGTESNAGVHLLLHVIVSADGQYKYSHATLASTYVGEQLWANHSEQMIMNLQEMLFDGPFELRRRLFEIYGHCAFSSGGFELKCRNLTTGVLSALTVDKLDGARVPLRQDLLPSGPILEYHQRLDDDPFPAVDALSPQGMLQFTVSEDHPKQEVEVLKRLCALHDQPKLYFVVPPHRFKNFAKQNHLPTKGPSEVGPIENLEQYVVELPFRGN
ncbi:hypothetical protein HDU81_000416 [Chytriomyces hyalinus]|nr:hypothetical protein HDU81_000416 [Chytriomyces hyalinus]